MRGTIEAALESPKGVDRRTFFKRFAQVTGIMAAAGTGTLSPSPAAASFSFGPKVDPRWQSLVSALKDYVTRAYVKYDRAQAGSALELLKANGITEDEVSPLQNSNRWLMPKGMFLTYFYIESPAAMPVIKLFLIVRRDLFDGFTVDGRKRTSLFGRKLEVYGRVLLGEEIFSTIAAPPVALPYNLAPGESSKPDWVIAIPYKWIHDFYGRQAAGLEQRLVEELTIHEITHIVHHTRDELLPFLAQFGYRMDDDRPMSSVDDLIGYLKTKLPTYHQAERLVLERICHADAYYGSSGNFAHLNALKQIKDGLVTLSEEVSRRDPSYPRNPLKISDQQCGASMTLLYHRAVERLAVLKDRSWDSPT
jgi:hypothetical protein